MKVFDDANFTVFDRTLQKIVKEYNKILPIFGNDIHKYVTSNATPYNINIPMQSILTFVDNNYIDICEQVAKIFESTKQLSNTAEYFDKYYTLLKSAIEEDNGDELSKTKKIAVVLILISKNVNTATTKKIQLILKSMCVMPTVGVLVQVSSNVLSDN